MSPARSDRDFPGTGIRETVHTVSDREWTAYRSPEQELYEAFLRRGMSPEAARIATAADVDTSSLDVHDEPPPTDALASAAETSANWRAVWTFARQGDQVVVRSVTIEPVDPSTPDGGITSAVLRELSPSRAIQEAVEGLREQAKPGTFGELLLKRRTEEVEPYERTAPSGPKGGRPRLSDDHLRAVTTAYLEEQKDGRGLLKRLGARFNVSEQTARDWVHAARKREFLTPARQGVRGSASYGPRFKPDSATSSE
ncbi:hypothetical protein [Streptosporangium sp. NPDC006930]|uniref:hypothetical protein n=1 Tax=Streptosporangium sp. NPDC006930 TaxID=3154783 RepID=UPI00342794BA